MKYIPLVLFVLYACQPAANKNEIKDLREEVMEIHDEVMPKMGDLMKVQKELKMLADSLKTLDSEKAELFSAAAENIANANEGMMQWMRAYEPDMEGEKEAILEYLEKQKELIQKVKDDMNGSLEKGKKMLQ